MNQRGFRVRADAAAFFALFASFPLAGDYFDGYAVFESEKYGGWPVKCARVLFGKNCVSGGIAGDYCY